MFDDESNTGHTAVGVLDSTTGKAAPGATQPTRGVTQLALSEAQQRASVHGDGPLLVLAGAGSGKTRTIAARVAHLLGEGVAPERLCLLTFSRRAAHELLGRAGLSCPQAARVWGGTFHAVANRFLRLHGQRVGLAPSFTVLDQGDVADLHGWVRHDLGFGGGGGGGGGSTSGRGSGGGGAPRFPRKETLAAISSRVVNAQQPLARVVEEHYPWCADAIEGMRAIFPAVAARKREHQVLDYDDLLLFWRALATSPRSADAMADAFDHVLVDEYQDTNALQADILEALCPGGRGLTVVGDDAQAIYGFRAATARNILDFPQRFPGTDVVLLDRNHRSTPPVLAMANALIAEAPEEHSFRKALVAVRPGSRRPVLRTCEDEGTQASVVCDRVLAHREEGVALRRQAVLFRASHHADVLEVELTRRGIPYVKYGGLKFLEAGHVKDLLGLLRVLDNPADELAWFRVLQLPEGVGPATAKRILDSLMAPAVGSADVLASPLARFLAVAPEVSAGARQGVADLRSALEDCAGEVDGPAVSAQVDRLIQFLTPVIERAYDAPAQRLADLAALVTVAADASSRGRFLADLTLDPPTSTSDLAGPPLLDEDWLTLSTVHSAKGMEWDVVHVIHAADGMFPSDMATGSVEGIEEERRLLYVACTRARDVLEINVPHRYHHQRTASGNRADAHTYSQTSRFLTPAVQALMDAEHAGRPSLGNIGADPSSVGAVLDSEAIRTVDALLADLWG